MVFLKIFLLSNFFGLIYSLYINGGNTIGTFLPPPLRLFFSLLSFYGENLLGFFIL